MIKISSHTHPESYLTASTLAAMIKRSKDLGREYFSYTDSGHLSSCLKAYTAAKKEGLKFAAGIEIYFKDPQDQLITGTKADRCKYFNTTIFCKTQPAYQALCKMVSRTDLPKTTIFEEEQSLWGWNELEEISRQDTLLVVGGPHDLVGKTYLAGEPEIAEKLFVRLHGLFGDRLSVSLICEPWDKHYTKLVKIDYTDGTHDSILATDLVSTDKARKIKAIDLVKRGGHSEIKFRITNNTFFEVGKRVSKVEEHKGYLPLPVDVTKEINTFLYQLAKKYNVSVILSDYAFYAEKEDRIVQEMVLEGKIKFKSNFHMKETSEFESYLKCKMDLPSQEIASLIESTNNWAKNFDNFELKYDWRLADTGPVPALQQCMEIIKRNGRMKWDDPRYVAQLREEIKVIAHNGKKDLSGYFLPIVEVLDYYRKNGYITSIGRGSAGASLFCYCLNITHIDPIKWDLPFSRFFSLDRINSNKLPDIDVDLPTKEPLIGKDGKSGFLFERWGDKACQVSSRARVRLKSAIKDTNRYFNGTVERDIESLTKALPPTPQNTDDHDFVFGYEDEDENHVPGLIETSDLLKEYIANKPKDWNTVQKAMGLTRAFSVHPCATLIADVPISEILPTKNGTVCQYEYKQAEEAGLIKYDFLCVSQLLDIQECIKLINKKNGDPEDPMYFMHKGQKVFVWDLPQDPEVYKSVWNGQTKTLFQIHTPGMSDFTKELLPENINDISSTLAFQRPGPLDYYIEENGRNMAEEYLYRRSGKSSDGIPELKTLLPDTYGIICYQEDLNKIARTISSMDGETAEKLRENMAKKKMKDLEKMKPIFIDGTSKKIDIDIAETIWNQMVTFGRYGFSIIHSLEYSHYTYATMFLRHHYDLEWFCSILTNATEKEISGKLWDVVKDYLAPPDINLSTDKMEIDYANRKIRSKLGVIRGMGDKSIQPIVENRPYKDIQDFVNKDVAGAALTRKLIHVGVLDSLFPPKSTFLEKLQLFEDALEVKKYYDKVEKAKAEGKLIKQLAPKKGEVPEEYLNIEKDPMKNAAVRKSILPSLLVGLYDLGRHHSKCIPMNKARPSRIMVSPYSKENLLITGEMLQRLNEMPGEVVTEDKYVAVTAFVLDVKVFDYAKNTKQALKITLDCDSYTGEYVQWPDFFTGHLDYPKEIKKNNIVTAFLKKRAGKSDPCTIVNLVIEA